MIGINHVIEMKRPLGKLLIWFKRWSEQVFKVKLLLLSPVPSSSCYSQSVLRLHLLFLLFSENGCTSHLCWPWKVCQGCLYKGIWWALISQSEFSKVWITVEIKKQKVWISCKIKVAITLVGIIVIFQDY